MSIEVRPATADELPVYFSLLARVFSGATPPPRAIEVMTRLTEVDRTLAAFDGDSMVATAGIFSFRMTLPGRVSVPAAGVTRVSVRPTHRRRGILREVMRRQLDDVHARGEAIAALYASQAPIYGRFGYGVGTWHAHLALDRGRAKLRGAAAADGVRMLDRDEAVAVATRVHDAVAPAHPGAVHRTGEYWEARFEDPPELREGASELNHVGVEAADGGEGIASYRIRRRWRQGDPTGTVEVREHLATSPGAALALWRFCASIDLMTRLEADGRRPDEPLRLALADPRALRVATRDGIWVRLVDVERALAARRYAAGGRLVLRVHDGFCSWNEGTFGLEVGEDGTAECRRVDAAPDLELDVADLGAAYLGGNAFARLAASGLLRGSQAAVAAADALFRCDDTAWCPTHF